MIQVENLSKSYGSDKVLDSISFVLNKGERCGLVGRNGSGKTTLFRLLTNRESPDGGAIQLPKSYRLGYLDQHIQFSQPTIREEAVTTLPPGREHETYVAEKILSGLGFKESDFDRSPSDFSGGYQLRLHLAKVLISDPDCLLLDEPTNYLDIVSIRWFERFLKRWRGELIIISHDRTFMDEVSSHTMGIHRQQIVKVKGCTETYYSQVLLQEESHSRQYEKLQKKREHAEDYIRRFGAKATKATQAQSRQKMLDKMPSMEKLAALQDLDFHFAESRMPGKRMLEVESVSFCYPGMEKLIHGVNFTIGSQDRLAIVGKNGRGKSTLLRLLAQDLPPDAGSLWVSENACIGYFGQTNIQRLNPSLTIEEEISSANPKLSFTGVRNICGLMMFSGDKGKKPISVLSGGEKSRVLLGKILASPCNLLLLDEPTNHLDLESVEALKNALEVFSGAVVLVTHSELLLSAVPNKLIICREKGQEVFEGNYKHFLEKIGWEEDEVKGSAKKKLTKEGKRERAEKLQECNKALKPLRKQAEKLEAEIMRLEKEIEEHTASMVEGVDIANQSHQVNKKQKRIDLCFEELEDLQRQMEQVKSHFECS